MKQRPWRGVACATVAAFAGLGVIHALAAPSGWLAVDGQIRFNPAIGPTVDWANSGLGPPTGACGGAGAVDIGGAGGLFNCGRPGAAGAPPIAPTLTPAAAADPSIISAVFIVNPISTDVTSCGAGAPSFSGKNGDPISSYTFSTGPIPDKDTITNVYAVSHTRSSDGHPELYFAAERLVNNGDSHIDFEFLQSQVTLSGACSGSFSGHRTEGDLLVAVDFTTGGSLAGTSVYQWHCAAEPGPQPADGTVCDPSISTPAHYQLIATPGILTLAVNAAPIACGGWVCRDKIAGNTTTVASNDFLEGGINLEDLPFTGCFSTFLPHTRTAQSFTSVLKDFAGPIGFHSCRNSVMSSTSAPTGVTVSPGTAATDAVTASNGGAGLQPTGSITFFLCAPAQMTGAGCPSGGTQVGGAKVLTAGAATSDPTTSTTTVGKYCWRTVYAPDPASTGLYAPGTHTNATTECFSVDVVASLPNTGVPAIPVDRSSPLGGLIVVAGLTLGLAWRRIRAMAAVLIAGVVLGSAPPLPVVAPAPSGSAVFAGERAVDTDVQAPSAQPLHVLTVHARPKGWRLVIPRIGVDAPIERVGLDQLEAMASPSSLDAVGWFDQGPAPGEAGDAVIAGHFGLPREPAVFRNLQRLRLGDAIQVIWPDGREVDFRVATSEIVPASAHPPGVFAQTGPARLSLITCGGTWIQGQATYSDRLIVTAVPA